MQRDKSSNSSDLAILLLLNIIIYKCIVCTSGAPNWLVDPMDSADSVMQTRKLARSAGCHVRSSNPGRQIQQLGQCLMKVDANRLVKAEAQVGMTDNYIYINVFFCKSE